MSTRATYSFKSKHGLNVTVYIHYDGDPEGAAQYLMNTYYGEVQRGGLATKFIRYNPLSEITVSHTYHSDTDYRYSFDDDFLIASRRGNDNKFVNFFTGDWHNFVNEYGCRLEEFKQIEIDGHRTFETKISFLAKIKCRESAADFYAKDHPEFIGNIESSRREISEFKEAARLHGWIA